MDLTTIRAIEMPRTRAELPRLGEGAAWLAGGTWLFSEPQPRLRRLIDLSALGWEPLELDAAGLRIGATCTIAELERLALPAEWRAAPLFGQCCRSLLGSFKVWNTATVGGNVCLSLPAAPMVALTVALDGVAQIWRPDGSDYQLPMIDFTVGANRNALAPGEILRAIALPVAALQRRVAMRQMSLTALGRSGALLVVSHDVSGRFALTITASTPRPLQKVWPDIPAVDVVDDWVASLPHDSWYDDVHGAPAWRRQVTRVLAAELVAEMAR